MLHNPSALTAPFSAKLPIITESRASAPYIR